MADHPWVPEGRAGDLPRRRARAASVWSTSCSRACWALEDWLYDDDHITPRTTEQELDEHVQGSKALTVCTAYANTSKHGKRNSPAELHARIKGFRIRSGVTKS